MALSLPEYKVALNAALTASTDLSALAPSAKTAVEAKILALANAIAEATFEYGDGWVAEIGDTMSGPLVINPSAPGATQLRVMGSDPLDIAQFDMGVDLNPIPPPGAITAALAGVGAGNIDNGTHDYYVTFVDANGGETELSNNGGYHGMTVTVADKTVNGQVDVTLPISTDARTVGRRVYRAKTGSYYLETYLLADIADNTTVTYRDNLSDASRPGTSSQWYRANTTSAYLTIAGTSMLMANGRLLVLGVGAGQTFFAGTATGGDSCIVGPGAGASTTSGTSNCLFGNAAGAALTSGSSNTFIGHSAGNSATSNSSNTCVGRNSGKGNPNQYTCLGMDSGGTSPRYGVCVGKGAGNAQTVNVIGNTLLGWNAGNNITSSPYNTIIGTSSKAPLATGVGGQINIANVLYGLGGLKTTSPTSTPTTDGKLGIGLTTPTARLHLPAGTASAGYAPLKLTSGPLLSTPEAGAVEFLTDSLYYTDTAGPTRRKVAFDGEASPQFMPVKATDSTPYTVLSTDMVITIDAFLGNKVVDLPAVATSQGRVLYIKKNDASANTVTVDASGAETIDGATTQVLSSQYEVLRVVCGLTEWMVI